MRLRDAENLMLKFLTGQLCFRLLHDQGYQARKWSCIAGRISSSTLVKVEFFRHTTGFFYTKSLHKITSYLVFQFHVGMCL